MTAADFTIDKDSTGVFQLIGALDIYHIQQVRQVLERASKESQSITLDLSRLTKLDTGGALLLRRYREKHQQITLRNLTPEHEALFTLVSKIKLETEKTAQVKPWPLTRQIVRLGRKTAESYHWSLEIIAFIGQFCVTFGRAIVSPKHLRLPDITHHIEETGIEAIAIISVMAFMIAVVLAYQGVAQLKPLGAEYLTVNLVSISVLREMGVLLTAIMVAGRSGSAFAAEIGVMKVREEVDALQVIGINPFEVLVMPRLIALLITLPLLTFLADLMGILGGGVMSQLLINISFEQYMDNVQQVARGKDFMVGMIKAPVFAFLIAMAGCMHGMKVSGSAESVGRETTAAVVKSIFLVLIADAFFSVLFQKMGI